MWHLYTFVICPFCIFWNIWQKHVIKKMWSAYLFQNVFFFSGSHVFFFSGSRKSCCDSWVPWLRNNGRILVRIKNPAPISIRCWWGPACATEMPLGSGPQIDPAFLLQGFISGFGGFWSISFDVYIHKYLQYLTVLFICDLIWDFLMDPTDFYVVFFVSTWNIKAPGLKVGISQDVKLAGHPPVNCSASEAVFCVQKHTRRNLPLSDGFIRMGFLQTWVGLSDYMLEYIRIVHT